MHDTQNYNTKEEKQTCDHHPHTHDQNRESSL
jgi:hypothetical protein